MKKTFLLLLTIFFGNYLFPQTNFTNQKVNVIKCSSFGISRPLRELLDTTSSEKENETKVMKEAQDAEHRVKQIFKFSVEDDEKYGDDIKVRQTEKGNRQAQSVLTNWAGQVGLFYPPD